MGSKLCYFLYTQGHLKVGVERHKPTDQIELGKGKVSGTTVTATEYPGIFGIKIVF